MQVFPPVNPPAIASAEASGAPCSLRSARSAIKMKPARSGSPSPGAREPMTVPAQFQVLSGAATGTKYELAKAETRIGRHPDCEVKIDLSAASRFHAHIIKDGEQHYIEDLGSRNKTYVNGKPI